MRREKVGKLCHTVPNFDSIRPYRDEEVPSVVRRLSASAELRDGIASFLFPRLYKFSPVATRQLTAFVLAYQAPRLKTVHDVQMMVGRFIDRMVRASVDDLSWGGIERLERGKPYLFVSNHRDITLDSALLNRVLHEENFPTCQIAVGDNLFGRPYADDLMRLNRGFLVERNAAGPKASYAALLRTSGYIRESLESGVSVWIAQRAGRAKDGFDRTEPALIKMLALAFRQRKARSSADSGPEPAELDRLDELLKRVQIVPVAISYELDPCDLRKAEELFHRATDRKFVKAADADFLSIVEGMRGYKGRVHLNFARPLAGSFESAEEIARAMDLAIVGGLKVYPSNLRAFAELHAEHGPAASTAPIPVAGKVTGPTATEMTFPGAKALDFFKSRLSSISEQHRPYLLLQYANLLRNRAELGLAAGTTSPAESQTSSL